jgi:NMD protein affecting ribosome stability and mRNA decay
MKAWSDVSVLRCPNCGHYYVDASWYVVEMESDIECGHCETEFNSKKNATDRAMLEFQIDENGKMQRAKVLEHLKLE